MFKFFFIKKHEKSVLNYIKSVYVRPQTGTDTGIRYCLSIEPKLEEDDPSPILYSDRDSGDSHIKYQKKPSTQTPPASKPDDKPGDEEPTILYSDRDPAPEEKQIRYSHRPSAKSTYSSGDIKYSDRGGSSDVFDPALVASLMSSYLQERTPVKPLSATTNLTFVQKLEQHIRNKHLVEADVYNSVFMDRKLFNKIRNDPYYQPSKKTALLLSIALHLTVEETRTFLGKAGFSLTHTSKVDIVIEFFMLQGNYNIHDINEALYDRDLPLLTPRT